MKNFIDLVFAFEELGREDLAEGLREFIETHEDSAGVENFIEGILG